MASDEVLKNNEQWKQPGEMTGITEDIQGLADCIEGEGVDYLRNVRQHLRGNYYILEGPKKPDRLKRTAQEILFPAGDVERDSEGRLPIGTCTEHGKAIRALAIVKGIPCVWIETLEKEWIKGQYPDGHYSGHIFLEVYTDGKWWILNTTAHPKDPEVFIMERTEPPTYLSRLGDGIAKYEVIATGLDSRSLQAPDGTPLSFRTRKEWRDYVDGKFRSKKE